jgi:hypothetical protein
MPGTVKEHTMLRRLFLALAVAAAPVSAHASPAINSEEASHVAHHSATSPLTWSFNNVGGTTLFVAVDVTQGAPTPAFGAVTYNGVAMTAVPNSIVKWYSNANQIQWYYLNNPATGSHTVSVSATLSGGDIIAAAISFTGLDPTTPYGTPVTKFVDTGAGVPSASVSVAGTTNGNYVLSAVANGDFVMAATSPTVLSAQLDVSGSTAGDNLAIGRQLTSGGTVAAAYSWGGNDYYGLTAFEAKAATGTQAISQVNLSNSSFAGGSPSGTVVGTISEVMSPASPAFSGTLALSGADAALFQIAGSNLQTNGVVAPGTYHINIVATEAGTTGSPFTQAETIVGTQSIVSASLSNSSFVGGSASGTVVGAISVTMSPASPAFSGTLSLSGTDAAKFQIVGANLETNGVQPAGSYSINIVATESGAVGSPFTQAATITGTGPLVLRFLPQVACTAPPGTLVMAFQTSGGDGNTVTYSLAGDTTDFALSGTNVVVGSSGIAPANCGLPNAVTVTAAQP